MSAVVLENCKRTECGISVSTVGILVSNLVFYAQSTIAFIYMRASVRKILDINDSGMVLDRM